MLKFGSEDFNWLVIAAAQRERFFCFETKGTRRRPLSCLQEKGRRKQDNHSRPLLDGSIRAEAEKTSEETTSKERNNIWRGEASRAPSPPTRSFPPTLHLHSRWASSARADREPLRSLERAGSERNDGDAAPAAASAVVSTGILLILPAAFGSSPDRENKTGAKSERTHARKKRVGYSDRAGGVRLLSALQM